MKNHTRAALAAAAIATCLVSTAAPAATCWSQADVSAAKVRELQTRLMVAALRCRATGVNILASYNNFVGSAKPAIVAANAGPESCAEAANLAAEASNAKADLAAFAEHAIPVATMASSVCPGNDAMVLAAK
jgi:hypothetical protein